MFWAHKYQRRWLPEYIHTVPNIEALSLTISIKNQLCFLQWKFTSLLLAFISLYGCCTADTSESAHLLVSKRVLNEYVVEGRDLTVSYAIYNVGSSPATSVSLVEETFSSDDFEIVSGQLSVRWQSIAPYPFYIMSPYSCCVWM